MEKDLLVIDEHNFSDYFRDVRKSTPDKGDIMVCYSAVAYFGSSNEKQNMIDLLKISDKAKAAAQVMKKLHGADERDSFRVPREIAEDLMEMSEEAVLNKEYKYNFQMFFYTQPEYVPKDNPHWTTVSILNVSNKVKIDMSQGVKKDVV